MSNFAPMLACLNAALHLSSLFLPVPFHFVFYSLITVLKYVPFPFTSLFTIWSYCIYVLHFPLYLSMLTHLQIRHNLASYIYLCLSLAMENLKLHSSATIWWQLYLHPHFHITSPHIHSYTTINNYMVAKSQKIVNQIFTLVSKWIRPISAWHLLVDLLVVLFSYLAIWLSEPFGTVGSGWYLNYSP